MTTTTKATWLNENNEVCYDWSEIDHAAGRHAIASTVLRDFAHDNITDEMTGTELAAAYFDWLDAEKEAVREAIYPLQGEWFAAHSDCETPTDDRTDGIMQHHIDGIQHPGSELRAAVFAAMDEWIAGYEDDE